MVGESGQLVAQYLTLHLTPHLTTDGGHTKRQERLSQRRCFTCVGPSQMARPNSYRLMNSPITRSCMRSVLEKHSVRRTNRLIRVRIDVLALDFLRILLAYVMLLDIDMPLIGPTPVGVILCDAKGLSQLLQPQEGLAL